MEEVHGGGEIDGVEVVAYSNRSNYEAARIAYDEVIDENDQWYDPSVLVHDYYEQIAKSSCCPGDEVCVVDYKTTRADTRPITECEERELTRLLDYEGAGILMDIEEKGISFTRIAEAYEKAVMEKLPNMVENGADQCFSSMMGKVCTAMSMLEDGRYDVLYIYKPSSQFGAAFAGIREVVYVKDQIPQDKKGLVVLEKTFYSAKSDELDGIVQIAGKQPVLFFFVGNDNPAHVEPDAGVVQVPEVVHYVPHAQPGVWAAIDQCLNEGAVPNVSRAVDTKPVGLYHWRAFNVEMDRAFRYGLIALNNNTSWKEDTLTVYDRHIPVDRWLVIKWAYYAWAHHRFKSGWDVPRFISWLLAVTSRDSTCAYPPPLKAPPFKRWNYKPYSARGHKELKANCRLLLYGVEMDPALKDGTWNNDLPHCQPMGHVEHLPKG